MSYPRTKDPDKCPEIVPTSGLRMNYHWCRGKVVKDGYCRVHHPDAVKARREESQKKYEEKWANSPIMRLKDAQTKIEELQRKLAVAREALQRIADENDYLTVGIAEHALIQTAPKP